MWLVATAVDSIDLKPPYPVPLSGQEEGAGFCEQPLVCEGGRTTRSEASGRRYGERKRFGAE